MSASMKSCVYVCLYQGVFVGNVKLDGVTLPCLIHVAGHA